MRPLPHIWQRLREFAARDGIRAAALWIASLALMTHLYLGVAIIPPASSDGVYTYHILASLLGDGDLDFTNNYQVSALPPERRDPYGYLSRRTPAGLPTSEMTIGPAILWLPFAAAGRLIAAISEPPVAGWPVMYRYGVMTAVGWSGVVFVHLAALLLAGIFRRYLGRTWSMLCSLSMLWLTNILFYATQQPLFGHAADLLMVTLTVWLLWRFSLRWETRWAILAGFAGGLAISVRAQNAVSLAILVGWFGVAWARLAKPSRRAVWTTGGLFAAGALIGVGPQIAMNLVLFGTPIAIPQGPGFLNLAGPHLWEGLFSTRNGLFVYSPFLLVGVIGALLLPGLSRAREGIARRIAASRPGRQAGPLPDPPRAQRAEEGNWRRIGTPKLIWLVVLPMALVFAAQLWINTSARDWWGGAALGQRRLISSYPFFAAGIAAGWARLRRARSWRLRRGIGAAAGVFAAGCLAINLALVSIAPGWGDADHDPARDVSRYVSDVLRREVEMRPGCGQIGGRMIHFDGVLFGDRVVAAGVDIHAAVTSPDQMLGLRARLDAVGERVHFGFRLATPYGWRNSVTLMLWDADSGEPLGEQIYYNPAGEVVGVTAVMPRSAMTIRAEAYFNNTRLPDSMPVVVRDIELCEAGSY